MQFIVYVPVANRFFNEMIREKLSSVRKNLKFIQMNCIDKTCDGIKIDYLYYEPIDFELGVLRKDVFSDLMIIKNLHLKNGDQIFPPIINIVGMLIESDSLENESKLISNENLCIENVFKKDYCLADLTGILSDYKISHQLYEKII
jgi:hypothetical protein